MSTRCLIFDLGKVLIDFSIDRWCNQVAEVTGAPALAVKSFLFDSGIEHRFESGEFEIEDLKVILAEKFHPATSVSFSSEALRLACADIFKPMTESIDLIANLKRHANIPMILLSNTNHVHWEFVCEQYGVHNFFDHHVLSFRVKAMKPDPKIYQAALACSGFLPEECFFTDDIPANVLGASQLGIDAVQFVSAQQIRRELAMRGVKCE